MERLENNSLSKREQISRVNRVMFLWVVAVSAVVGFSIVLMIFLVQRIWFGEKVIAEKMQTVSTLENNIKTVPQLEDNERVLNTNENLMAVRADESDPAIQSILDALPADANSTAMASSLQTKILGGVPGITIEALTVDDVTADGISSNIGIDASPGQIGFSFTVSTTGTNQDSLRTVLQRIERSIRPFNIIKLSVESQQPKILMTVKGIGYYEPAVSVGLRDKVLKP